MKFLLLTLKHFLRLKWEEIAKDDLNWAGFEVFILIVAIMFAAWTINCTIICYFWGCCFPSLDEILALSFGTTLCEIALFFLGCEFVKWILNNWNRAKRYAMDEIGGLK